MSEEDEHSRVDVEGMEPEEATSSLLDADDSLDRETVWPAMERVASDGTVSREAALAAIDAASAAVGAAERRLDLARDHLDDTREAAAGLEDVDRVEFSLSNYEARIDDLADSVESIAADLEALESAGESDASVFELGREVVAIERDSETVEERADELLSDLEDFEHWVRHPDEKLPELDVDAGEVEQLLDAVEQATEEVRATLQGEESNVPTDGQELRMLWIEARMRIRLIELLLDDLLSELVDLQEIADRADQSLHGVDGLATRLDGLESRRQTYVDRLETLQQPDWPGQFEPVLESFEETLQAETPPVDWGAVQATLQEHRAAIEDES